MTNKKTAKTDAPVAPAMKLIIGTDDIDAAIKSIATRGAKLDKDIWITAVSAMSHHDQHGDYDRINALVDAMPKGSRVNALREFITTFGKVTYDEQSKTFVHDKAGSFDLDGACAKSWTDFKPEAPYIAFDALKAIKAMVAKVDAVDASKGDKCTKEQAAAIKTLYAAMGGV